MHSGQASKPGGRSEEQPESEYHALLVTTLGQAPAERMDVKPCAAMPAVPESSGGRGREQTVPDILVRAALRSTWRARVMQAARKK